MFSGYTAGTQHANACTRACIPRLEAARATSEVRSLTHGALSAHLAGAKRLDFGARRARPREALLLRGSPTAAGRREVSGSRLAAVSTLLWTSVSVRLWFTQWSLALLRSLKV